MPPLFLMSRAFARPVLVLSLVLLPAVARAQDGAPHPARGAAIPIGTGRADVEAAISFPACNDFDRCTLDSCDTTTGTCRFEPQSCDDGNPCTEDSCVPDGGCVSRPAPREGAACDDGNTCTLQDTCVAGTCRGELRLVAGETCDDRNACTTRDACSPSGTCEGIAQAAGQSCDDGNACTSDDRCVQPGPEGALVCAGAARDCGDGDFCTEDRCDAATGLCSHPAVSCDDGNECSNDACDPATGTCRREPAAGPCDDGNYRTIDEACQDGNCVGGQQRNCGQDYACADYYCDPFDRACKSRVPDTLYPCGPPEQCSASACTRLGGYCQLYNLSGPCNGPPGSCYNFRCGSGLCLPDVYYPGRSCDDGNPCTTGDVCGPSASGCFGTPVDCSDGHACTLDSCNGSTGACEHADAPVDACDDHDACTLDSCDASADACHNTPMAAGACDDGDPCTDDVCDHRSGCVHPPKSCNDSDPCTTDRCAATTGSCINDPINCDDGNECTHEQCIGGACVTDPYLCEDFNQCTLDACTGTSCAHVPVAVGTPCYDGFSCTRDDACIADPVLGVKCVGIGPDCDDGNRCTVDVLVDCVCEHLPIGGAGTPPPPPETCNGVDDDCDGQVDERELLPLCTVRPLIMRDSGASSTFTVTCRWSQACPGAPVPAPLDEIRPVWLSAADLLLDPADNTPLPSPLANCDMAIVEDPAKRLTGAAAVTFVFDVDGNSVCGTGGRGREGLMLHLADVPDGKLARVCVRSLPAGPERCGIVLVHHDSVTEPQPVSPVGEERRLLLPAP